MDKSSVEFQLNRLSGNTTFNRSRGFSSNIMNRFYTDSSLNKKDQLIKRTKERQERMRARTIMQGLKAEALQHLYEREQMITKSQSKRQRNRIKGKENFEAACTIQLAWKKHLKRKLVKEVQTIAVFTLVAFIKRWLMRVKNKRYIAARRIQYCCKSYMCRLKLYHSREIIRRCVCRFIDRKNKARRILEYTASTLIQKSFIAYKKELRLRSLQIIQKNYRASKFRKLIVKLNLYAQYLHNVQAMNVSASKIQFAIGDFVAKKILKAEAKNLEAKCADSAPDLYKLNCCPDASRKKKNQILKRQQFFRRLTRKLEIPVRKEEARENELINLEKKLTQEVQYLKSKYNSLKRSRDLESERYDKLLRLLGNSSNARQICGKSWNHEDNQLEQSDINEMTIQSYTSNKQNENCPNISSQPTESVKPPVEYQCDQHGCTALSSKEFQALLQNVHRSIKN